MVHPDELMRHPKEAQHVDIPKQRRSRDSDFRSIELKETPLSSSSPVTPPAAAAGRTLR